MTVKAVTSIMITCVSELDDREGGYRANIKDPFHTGQTLIFVDKALDENTSQLVHQSLVYNILKLLAERLPLPEGVEKIEELPVPADLTEKN